MADNRDSITMDETTEVILKRIEQDVSCIKKVLMGKDGVVIEVDRLKRSHAVYKAVVWAVAVAAITVVADLVKRALAG